MLSEQTWTPRWRKRTRAMPPPARVARTTTRCSWWHLWPEVWTVGLEAHSHRGFSWRWLLLILNTDRISSDHQELFYPSGPIIKQRCTFDFQEGAPGSFTGGAGGHTRVNPRVWQLMCRGINTNMWGKAAERLIAPTQNVMTPLITLLTEEPPRQ